MLLTSKFDAVASCLIKKLSAEEAVAAKEALTALRTNEEVSALSAHDEVPNREPVMLGAVREPVTWTEPVSRVDPDAIKLLCILILPDISRVATFDVTLPIETVPPCR